MPKVIDATTRALEKLEERIKRLEKDVDNLTGAIHNNHERLKRLEGNK